MKCDRKCCRSEAAEVLLDLGRGSSEAEAAVNPAFDRGFSCFPDLKTQKTSCLEPSDLIGPQSGDGN